MADYIAHGKDQFHESSVKVIAETDEEAFCAAKRRLPIVSSMERIESDGTFTAITHFPFDDLHSPNPVNPDQEHLERGQKLIRKNKKIRAILVFILVVVPFKALPQCAAYMARSRQPNGEPAVQPESAPASIPQK